MARAETPAGLVAVEVVYSRGPGHVDLVALALQGGSTLADALQASGLLARHGLGGELVRAGIWGKVKDGATVLRDHDRVEIYRPLKVDPKEARRQRYRKDRHTRATKPQAAA